ncbi:HpcH/HpaI aldolase/citrate lyase family protein [Corynebacterium hansenii]|uniref:HpcH/HpaI aldolase/citrate lyase family protein n=1 Tax=Corynebacterium hansenii TaxID=394964 RepID=A0ABV7ZPD6_9CORY|nr:CoA ester lyase [Corynebacterium hansenii]WJY99156.1 Citrate lyase subunit beta-like protein [Corynebacterium hansenii]
MSTSDSPAWLPAGPALLFAPADRPDRFAKAAERSDVVIVDLEDGAALDGHEAARRNVLDHPLDPARTILRVTGPDAPTFAGDAELAQEGPYDVVMLPKVRDRIPEELAGLKIIAMIETPQAILNIGAIASHPDVVGMFWGAEDLAAELGGTSSRITAEEAGAGARPYRAPQQLARTMMVIHAAANGIAAIDAVHVDFRDAEGQYLEALDAAGCGFAGTACIHPAMVEPVRRAYRPSDAELDRARRILERAADNVGAFQLDGEMIDAPVVRQAAITVARAGC